jgi:hypothetical protein
MKSPRVDPIFQTLLGILHSFDCSTETLGPKAGFLEYASGAKLIVLPTPIQNFCK